MYTDYITHYSTIYIYDDLSFAVFNKKNSESQTKAGNQNTLSLSLSLSLSHSLILSFTRSLSTCWTTFVFMSMLKGHSHTLSLSLLLLLSLLSQLSISHSITLDMLNNFCFHVYAQKSLFMAENCNGFFWQHHPPPVSLEFLELVPS